MTLETAYGGSTSLPRPEAGSSASSSVSTFVGRTSNAPQKSQSVL